MSNTRRAPRFAATFAPALALALALTGCGSGDATPTGTPTPAPFGVIVTPPNVTLLPGRTQNFDATVVAAPLDSPVTWQVVEGSSGGTITSDGLYTAPNAPGTYRVLATSVIDATKTGTATVTVQPGEQTGVAVTVSPSGIILPTGGGTVFTAIVTGTANQNVTWSVGEGSAGGAITQSGSYSAPLTPGVYTVIATSVADPTKSGSASVTVQ
jgi:hypothetical protein